MKESECIEAATARINAEAKIGVDTVCLLYNWVDDGMLPLSWLKRTYPGVHEQVAEWTELAAKESATKEAVWQGRLLLVPADEAPKKKKHKADACSSRSDGQEPSITMSASSTNMEKNMASKMESTKKAPASVDD